MQLSTLQIWLLGCEPRSRWWFLFNVLTLYRIVAISCLHDKSKWEILRPCVNMTLIMIFLTPYTMVVSEPQNDGYYWDFKPWILVIWALSWLESIVPNIHVRPIYWTYANICKRTRMIRDIRLAFLLLFFLAKSISPLLLDFS